MIDTSAIRNKVLVLAMQGKLSERLLEDDNVYDLYDAIMQKKDALIKAGTIRKDKKFDDIMENEIQYNIPKDWLWVRLGKIITLQSGQDLEPEEYNDQKIGIPYITGASNFNDDETLKINRWTHCPRACAKENDILFSCKGTVGKIAILHQEEVHIARQIMGIRTYCVDTGFMRYFLESVTEEIKAASKGLIPGIERNDLLNLCCPLPSLAEQKRIADQIEKIFNILGRIDNLQIQYSADLDILKNKIIDAGIKGKLSEKISEDETVEDLYIKIQAEKTEILERRKGREDKKIKVVGNDVPFKIPNHWKWIRLGDIALFKKGPFGSALTKSMFVPKGTDTVKVYEQQHAIKKNSELGTYYITREYFNEKMSGFEVLPGDIIVSCAGTIGETYIMPDEIEQGIINQALMRVTLAEGIDKKFFLYYFDANLKKNARDESNGSAIKNIPPFDVLKNWYFPLTSIEEQRRIVSKIDEILAYM